MKQEKSTILDKLGKDPGFRVPEHYFEDFSRQLLQSLPDVEITEDKAKPTLWVRLRPFVYMAAMFAGVWCMMTIFNMTNGTAEMDQRAAEISHGILNEKNAEEFILGGEVSDYDLFIYDDSVAMDNDDTPAN